MSKLPPRVRLQHGAYHYVRDHKWTRLSSIKDGLPGMHIALANLLKADTTDDHMPAVVDLWLIEVGSTHSKKLKANDAYQTRLIKETFTEFRAREVKPSSVNAFLKKFKAMPRTFNAYRSMLKELMRFAEEKDMRLPGSNPVDSVKSMPLKARTRYATDSELRRIKVAACYGDDRKRTRTGLMICALIDMAYLTGQRIGDLLSLQWSQVDAMGILFAPSKVEASTGQKVFIEWSPKLRSLVERIKVLRTEMGKDNRRIITHVFNTQQGLPYTYYGASTAWKRAVKRSGVRGCTFHDIRAKAITDVDADRGIGHAQRMGGHSTQSQTADYVRHKKAVKTGATK
jgi:integrase